MDKRQAVRIAHALGLTRLEDKHLGQLARGAESAHELSGKLPRDLHWSEEMALTFRLTDAHDKP